MWNPFRRKNVELPREQEQEELPDDWKPLRDAWQEICICHCGTTRKASSTMVCPVCGHKDKWEYRVARLTYEYSPARNWKYGNTYYWGENKRFRPDYRNVKWEEWTPEHCEAKDEEA